MVSGRRESCCFARSAAILPKSITNFDSSTSLTNPFSLIDARRGMSCSSLPIILTTFLGSKNVIAEAV
jgi:hypothetical protein